MSDRDIAENSSTERSRGGGSGTRRRGEWSQTYLHHNTRIRRRQRNLSRNQPFARRMSRQSRKFAILSRSQAIRWVALRLSVRPLVSATAAIGRRPGKSSRVAGTVGERRECWLTGTERTGIAPVVAAPVVAGRGRSGTPRIAEPEHDSGPLDIAGGCLPTDRRRSSVGGAASWGRSPIRTKRVERRSRWGCWTLWGRWERVS